MNPTRQVVTGATLLTLLGVLAVGQHLLGRDRDGSRTKGE